MSINLETIGGSLMVQHYVGTLGDKRHLILDSDVFTPTGKTTIHVTWELSVKAIDKNKCEFTNRVQSFATEEMLAFLDRQGIPFDIFRIQRQPMSIAHNKGETPLFAGRLHEALQVSPMHQQRQISICQLVCANRATPQAGGAFKAATSQRHKVLSRR